MSEIRCECHALAFRALSDGRIVTLCRRCKRNVIHDPASAEPFRSLVSAASRLRLRQRSGLDTTAEAAALDDALAALEGRFAPLALAD